MAGGNPTGGSSGAAKPHRLPRTLIFTATFNERGNIELLLERVFALDPSFEMLVVDDNSPDGTGQILEQIAATNPRLHVIQRPRKMGIGSAHLLAMTFSVRQGFDRLVTMDADFSHDPADIPRLLDALEHADFVIGSRYTEGGNSDYKGYRRVISVCGNMAAHFLLRIPLREFTTSFRAFTVETLKNRRCGKLRSSGYSFFMETVFRMSRAGVRMAEVPIQFKDRLFGISKIPRFEVINGISRLLWLSASSVVGMDKFSPASDVEGTCGYCHSPYLIENFASSPAEAAERANAGAYRCSSAQHRKKPRVAQCLQCGLIQIPSTSRPSNLVDLYREVEDPLYLEHRKAREINFEMTFRRIESFLPPPGRLLEIGAYCGLFLAAAKKRGWQSVGVEPSRWAASIAREQGGIEVHEGTLAENMAKLGGDFDAVVAWDVLEHVDSPYELLIDANRMLRPGGIFCFSTIDIDTWLPRLLGRQWPWIMDMHLYYFTAALLRRWLNDAGFDVVHDSNYRHYATLLYLWEKGMAIFPAPVTKLLRSLSRLFPIGVVIPISFGDVKLFVARKRQSAERAEFDPKIVPLKAAF